VDGAPLVVKLLEGTKGVGVVLAETSKAAESVVNAFRSLKADILVQQYIKESKGQDIRCFVVGGQVVASMERVAQEGEFRANIHLGATARAIEVSDEERDLAIKAAKIIGLEVAGVDMVRSNFGPKLLEVNSSPGLEGIESATGIDIAGKMIEFLENN
jgi:ribosomal protein S6--L-glutamate ligase